jgi:hypothetical protein
MGQWSGWANSMMGSWGGGSFGFGAGFSLIAIVVLVWSLYWKGMALWKAARATDKVWFVVLLLVNTLGILEIIYIYLVRKEKGMPMMDEKAM